MLGSAVFRTGVAPGGALAGPWVRDPLWTRARAVPSLDLRFADNKSLVDATTGSNLVTFTRASSGTFVGSNGVLQTASTDVPRFDHNPTTGESLGLLVEEQRTNLLLQSEDFSTTWATGNAAVSTNQIAAPNNTTTADLITADGANAVHLVSQTVTVSAVPYSFSTFIKAGTETTAIVRTFTALGNVNATFNLSTGTITSNSAGTTAQIIAFPNGWYRCIFNFTPTAATGGIGIYLGSLSASAISTTLYLWGAQLEAGASPTSYIPTTTAAATRSADVASITGSAFSGWYSQSEGSFYAENQLLSGNPPAGTFPGVFSANNGGSTNQLLLYWISTSVCRWFVREAGTITADIAASAVTAGSSARFAVRYASNDAAISGNGGPVGSDTSVVLPTVDRLTIGAQATFAPLSGTIRRLTYWPQRLANSTLQTLTQ